MPEQLKSVEEQLSERKRELDMMTAIMQVVGGANSLDAVLEQLTEKACTLLHAETVAIPIMSPDHAHYSYRAVVGRQAQQLPETELPISEGLCGWVMHNQRPWWCGTMDSLDEDDRTKWQHESGTLIVPLAGKQRSIGAIVCLNKMDGEEFDQADLDLLVMFAGHAGIAIENALAFDALRMSKNAADAHRMRLEKLNAKLIQANNELQFLTVHDALTGLPNRALIVDRIDYGIHNAARSDQQLALIMIDFNDFEEINDTFGRGAGDDLLLMVGERFAKLFDDNSTVGRLGGDEFALVLPDAGLNRALEVAQRITEVLQQPVDYAGQEIKLRASMGISVYPEHGDNASELMKCADEAMFKAKCNQDTVCVFNAQNNPDNDVRAELTRDLLSAIKRQEITLNFQPKIDLRTGKLVGAEALARWTHPLHGEVPPAQFVPILEQNGLIAEFALQVLDMAVCYCKQCERAGYEISVAVNLSTHNLSDEQLPDQIEDVLAEYELDSHRLTLEIAETMVLDDYLQSIEILEELSDMGIELAIDDFGTGDFSPSDLKRLPIKQLKIDHSLVSDMMTEHDDADSIQSIIGMAHSLGFEILAEGVETEAVLTALGEMGCDLVQGFLISRPLSKEEFFLFLKNCDWIVASADAA